MDPLSNVALDRGYDSCTIHFHTVLRANNHGGDKDGQHTRVRIVAATGNATPSVSFTQPKQQRPRLQFPPSSKAPQNNPANHRTAHELAIDRFLMQTNSSSNGGPRTNACSAPDWLAITARGEASPHDDRNQGFSNHLPLQPHKRPKEGPAAALAALAALATTDKQSPGAVAASSATSCFPGRRKRAALAFLPAHDGDTTLGGIQ
ncbi:uncharacterized protein TRIVIDRAFT_65750 [Trichoderma virens Gv29-8]|uniref:Uncharacterized protein n=1 Tax=Hypocrea virens (strain Gv29-8 / FGSC 10586) TaxID=413071 RepID=G9N963_HYPVG|nr:uncharacterized protein TRIVIDRAFT_65750 [Trichoderma virens Gv29-8]EHK16484.1 hypothetical protein TRIVIDRAFT_65750 [Trichoderma virens Gv29-8]UKZ52140.1 hypothetical protein TrVGV298_005915 [Trichoderma virens]